MNNEHTSGSLNQMMEIPSVGSNAYRSSGRPRDFSAEAAGRRMKSHNCELNRMAIQNAPASPHRQRMMRARSSSRCSRNDMRNRSEEHTSELQSPYVISYAVFC